MLALLFLIGCSDPVEPSDTWQPGVALASIASPNERGLYDVRGVIHAHSVYSHDACDEEPVKNGVRDQSCLEDFRRGVCQSRHDFVMTTDHPDAFAEHEYPELLLFDATRDELVERDGLPRANRMGCPDGTRPLLIPGLESKLMPVGLERHASDREVAYGETSTRAIELLREAGAVVLLAHTEDWSADQLADLPIDGFEMYNLHANALLNGGTILELLVRLDRGDTDLPQSDLSFVPIFSEDPRYLDTWGATLARGVRRVTTMGTDCHRNTFPALMPDGERVDSYRRMMMWFSNHLLVDRLDFDDRTLTGALAAGRAYGVIEVLGYAEGFDFVAVANGTTYEMGDEVELASAPELIVRRPRVRGLVEQPKLELRLLQATASGWNTVATAGEGDLIHRPSEPGAYRAEVRITPTHVAEMLGSYRPAFAGQQRVWVYSNPTYVR
jgi:hypothetical protein